MADSGSSGNEDENILPHPLSFDLNQNPSSPFYIHPSESSSSIVVSPPLSANNFQSWSRSFRMALISKTRWVFSMATSPSQQLLIPYTPLGNDEELDNYRTLTPCSCSARTYHSQDFIIRFLKGLDDRFAMVRSQILLLDPLPSTNRVFSMII
ncbi:hypothetical protein V8G54_037032 [Vigna mungo]|uniref:Retrotransposon Copia-like N-terminal domain-containing protein n=1 Tax=Vigna mungo TaxID=3915 RepID=A0AAQ3RDL4_VIGMU